MFRPVECIFVKGMVGLPSPSPGAAVYTLCDASGVFTTYELLPLLGSGVSRHHCPLIGPHITLSGLHIGQL